MSSGGPEESRRMRIPGPWMFVTPYSGYAPHLNIRHPTSNTQLKYRQEDLGNIYCSRDEDQSANQTKIMDYLIINVHKTGILRESTEINGLPR